MVRHIAPTYTLFLDRDGVINQRIIDGYVLKNEQFILIDGVLEALKKARPLFGRIVVVSNQQCIGKGLITQEGMDNLHRYFIDILNRNNIHIDGIYICPHIAEAHCSCRKPEIGLALQAQQEFPEIDFSKSVMIGDAVSDMDFGKRCGMRTIFIGVNQTISDDCMPSLYHYVNSISPT